MDSTTKYILLVDDDEDDRLFFQEALDDLNQPVTLNNAEHGLEAIEKLESTNNTMPDVIFLDLNMPVLDGHECLKQIRSNAAYNEVKIIIYSTSYNPEIANTLQKDGANYYLRKPSDYSLLKETINTALSIISGNSDKTYNFLINT